MKLNIATLLGAALLCSSLAVNAQSPFGDAGKGPGMMGHGGGHRMMKSCKDEADPAKCEARRKEMREHMKQAYEACKDNSDRRTCMTDQFCSRSEDPAKCQARAKERHARMSRHVDERQKAHEACTGKRGDELMKCLGEQHHKSGRGRPVTKG